MDPATASLVGSGMSFAGGLLDSRSSRKSAKAARWEARSQFNQQMDTSIQRRVTDAKKAGIHPLYAIGASAGASPTVSISGQHDSGSGIGSALQTLGRGVASYGSIKQQRRDAQIADIRAAEMHEANLRAINAQTSSDNALAALRASDLAMRSQSANHKRGTTDHKSLRTPFGMWELGPDVPQELIEQEYGGIVGEGYGVSRWAKDRWSQYQKKERPFYRQYGPRARQPSYISP